MSIHFPVPVPSGGGRREKFHAAATGLHWKIIGPQETNVKRIRNTTRNIRRNYIALDGSTNRLHRTGNVYIVSAGEAEQKECN
jgi:hypothetical protein